MHKLKIIRRNLKYYVDMLKNGKPFSFARYGDGEWLTILGEYGRKNSNGCTFTKALSDDLRQVLANSYPYDHAILKISLRKNREQIENYLTGHNIGMHWYSGDTILKASLRGRLFPLIEQIRKYRILYVGNMRLRGLNKRGAGFFPYVSYIEPPSINAHTQKDTIIKAVLSHIERYNINLIGWSSGLASKVFIDKVWEETNGKITQIDFGSVFDGYFEPMPNVRDGGSRSYIRKGNYHWEALREINTGKRQLRKGEKLKG